MRFPPAIILAFCSLATLYAQPKDAAWGFAFHGFFADYTHTPWPGQGLFSRPQRGLRLGVSHTAGTWMDANACFQLAPAQRVELPGTATAVLGTVDFSAGVGLNAANGHVLSRNARIKPVVATGLGVNMTSGCTGLYLPATIGLRCKVMEYMDLSIQHTYKVPLTRGFLPHQVLSFGFNGTLPYRNKKKPAPSLPPRLEDTDQDGVADLYDDCPDVFGLKDQHGCPAAVVSGQLDVPQKSAGAGRDGILVESAAEDAGASGVLFRMPRAEGLVSPTPASVQRMLDEEALRALAREITFPEGGSTLAPEQALNLHKLVEILDRHPDCKIRIAGHSDDTGNAQQNLIVSVKRAYSVKIFLIHDLQIPPERLEHEGFAALLPVSDNTTPEGRAQNRRVEFLLVNCPE